MKNIFNISILLSFFVISCDSFKNTEIEKIKTEVERQNREKEEIKRFAVEKAKKLFDTVDENSFEQFFFSEEVVVFKDKKTGVCLPMMYKNRSKNWENYGFLKNSELSVEYELKTYGDSVNFQNLKELAGKHCTKEGSADHK